MTPWMDEWGQRLSARHRSGDGEESTEEARWMPGVAEGAAERGIEPSRARDRGGCEERGEVDDSGGGEGMHVSAPTAPILKRWISGSNGYDCACLSPLQNFKVVEISGKDRYRYLSLRDHSLSRTAVSCFYCARS
ncbi:hypothetical protein OsJ_25396 [Oryza sativa Japonica Group]|uniref:Uncharacterized protein n=1 Tax=Oryza sativa subsp. japonica TaxID=39947 RepID=B9FUL1_ORYSJ|nr:hypothetical protein OsJ_25396 [Oryza sativa Japonica Group]